MDYNARVHMKKKFGVYSCEKPFQDTHRVMVTLMLIILNSAKINFSIIVKLY
jgi:hypothetical protein